MNGADSVHERDHERASIIERFGALELEKFLGMGGRIPVGCYPRAWARTVGNLSRARAAAAHRVERELPPPAPAPIPLPVLQPAEAGRRTA